MGPLASRLAPALLVALLPLTLGACNSRGRECAALRRVVDAAPAADAGPVTAASADAVLAEIDRIGTRTPELAGVRADYRAAMENVAAAVRKRDEALNAVLGALSPVGGGAPLTLDAGGNVEEHVRVLMAPCQEELFAAITGAIHQRPPSQKPKPDCEKLMKVTTMALSPPPGRSVAEHALAVAVGLEVPLEDPAMASAARSLAALLRQMQPSLARVTVPVTDLLVMSGQYSAAQSGIDAARAHAGEQADAVRTACPVR
jgi:hypothetical protein